MTNTKKEITKIIKRLGVPANVSGYYFVRYAIELAINDYSAIKQITKKLYPAVAQEFNTTPSRAERCIRRAIATGWLRADAEFADEVFGYSVSADKGAPTNSEFIAMVVDYIMLHNESANEVSE